MSVSCGFYNSLNGDRKYNTVQISHIFDGIIRDGIYASIGTAFVVKEAEGRTVNVGIGRAWFDHTWTLNDSVLPLEMPVSEVLLDRIDAVVLEVDSSENVRNNQIRYVLGTPSTQPERPTMAKTNTLHQYPLCYINRKAGIDSITQADITNMVGSEETPFVTGILATISLNELLGQWENELDQFVAKETNDFQEWFDSMKGALTQEKDYLTAWTASVQADFIAWFNQMQNQLGDDPAGHLQLEIDREEINRILLNGFTDGTKTFSDDGREITSTSENGWSLTKSFSADYLTATSTLKSQNGIQLAQMVKVFSADGKSISTATTYT